jgi:HEPN domain-containing protein
MNRNDFQEITEVRLRESKALLAAGFPEGAYYLAGYAVECALKACIAKRTQEHDFPEKESRNYYSHDLEELLGFAKLRTELDQSMRTNPAMKTNWIIVQDWSEASRYDRNKTDQEAAELLEAIEDQAGGLLPWLQQRW